MAPQVAVDIVGVSKRFRLYQEKYYSLKERVIHAGRNPYHEFWAVRDVNLEIYEGETIGILGRNGSGKSTLLKCVSGILQPTEGKVVVRGQLAALLELGAGFQAELSGRENIFLNASLLGMSTREVERRFDEIVAFAELEQFIDNQVKYYSSGMYVRLGFAVAVNVEPDILVVDEVLSVGDERFQRKCIDRVKTFQEEGRTILFVSHSPDQVRAICDRAVVLQEGRVVGTGLPGEAVRLFREHLLESGDILAANSDDPPSGLPPSEEAVQQSPGAETITVSEPPAAPEMSSSRPVRITDVRIAYPEEGTRPYLLTGEPLAILVGFDSAEDVEVVFSMDIRSEEDILMRTDTTLPQLHHHASVGRATFEICIDEVPLLDGAYQVAVGIESRHGMTFDWRDPACSFEVVNPGRATGLLSLPIRARVLPAGVDPPVAPRQQVPSSDEVAPEREPADEQAHA